MIEVEKNIYSPNFRGWLPSVEQNRQWNEIKSRAEKREKDGKNKIPKSNAIDPIERKDYRWLKTRQVHDDLNTNINEFFPGSKFVVKNEEKLKMKVEL